MEKENKRKSHWIIINDEIRAIAEPIFTSREAAEQHISEKGLSLTSWKIEERK
jgi:hypothetical protein